MWFKVVQTPGGFVFGEFTSDDAAALSQPRGLVSREEFEAVELEPRGRVIPCAMCNGTGDYCGFECPGCEGTGEPTEANL